MEISAEYVAGFFDGEGSIGIHRGEKHKPCDYQMYAIICQVDPTVLVFLHGKFAGSLFRRQERQRSWMKNPPRPIWYWKVSLRKAEAFLRWIEPHLLLKKDRARLALEFMSKRKPSGRPKKDDRGDSRGYEEMRLRMKSMNVGGDQVH